MVMAVDPRTDAPDIRLLAAVAHDLRTPLTAVLLNAQLLARQAQQACTPPAWLDESVAEIEQAAMRMARIIDEIIELARIRSGASLPFWSGSTDLVALATQMAGSVAFAQERQRIRLEIVEPALIGHWDASRLQRALENLLGNALKYSPPDREVVVRLAGEATFAGDWAVIVVRDQGRGIPAADLPLIFEPFWRGANVGQVAGSGLGLASVKEIVTAHGGNIAVESREGDGTTVIMRLPVA